MNSILVESWDAFKMSARKVIRDVFVKNKLPPSPPFSPPNLTTNTQAFATYTKYIFEPRLKKSTIYHDTQLYLFK